MRSGAGAIAAGMACSKGLRALVAPMKNRSGNLRSWSPLGIGKDASELHSKHSGTAHELRIKQGCAGPEASKQDDFRSLMLKVKENFRRWSDLRRGIVKWKTDHGPAICEQCFFACESDFAGGLRDQWNVAD